MPAASISPLTFSTPTNPLAFDGGQPSLATGFDASWPPTTQSGIGALQGVPPPDADDWNHPMVARLERHWQNSTGRSHVIACRSGRVALRLALCSLELGPGDEVICPADSCELGHYLDRSGVVAVPADLDPQTLQIDPQAVHRAVTPRTQAVVVVDRHGTTADYRALRAVARHHGLALVEDGSQSVGAAYENCPVGALGDVSLCSLVGDDARSSLGTSGLFATDDPELAATARRMLMVNHQVGSVADIQGRSTGWSCQLSDVDAAVAAAQLRRREEQIAARCVNGAHLRAQLASLPGIWTPDVLRSASHVYTTLPIVVVPDELGLDETRAETLRDTVIDCLSAEGLGVDRWQPQPLGDGLSRVSSLGRPGEFPVAEALVTNGLMIGPHQSPFDPPHTVESMDRIAECFHKLFVQNADRLRGLTLQRLDGRNVA